jgi:hypothetical protein
VFTPALTSAEVEFPHGTEASIISGMGASNSSG